MENFIVKIINYQRIKKATMEFIPGLNIIVGESNNGKTASVRSLETAIYNIPRENHISLGETKSAVGIQYNNHEVIWRRDKESASQVTYRIDGKIYQKLGRGQPEEVASALGIRELEVNDKKFRLNFSKQMSYPFLLDSTPSDMFKFIAQSSGEENLIDVLKQMKKDVNEISSKVKAKEESQKVLGESLNALDIRYKEIKGKRDYCNQVLGLEFKVKSLKDLSEKIRIYKDCTNLLNEMTEELNRYKNISDNLNETISSVELDFSKYIDLTKSLDNFLDINSRIDSLKDRLKEEDDKVLLLIDLDRQYEKFKSQEVNEVKLLSLKSNISRYREDAICIDNSNTSLSLLNDEVERYNKFIDVVGSVLEIKDEKEKDLSLLQDTLSNYSELSLKVKSYSIEIEKLKDDVNKVSKEIEEIGVCPYCGSILTGGLHEQH